jgi:hypothetical protein
MQITNLTVRRLTPEEFEMAKTAWVTDGFVPANDYWLATFDVDGQTHEAGLRKGRRLDVSSDTQQIDVQLRVLESAFDADSFLPEAQAADIVRAVIAEFEKQGWNLP